MGAKIGTGDVSFRLGSATPAAVYLGGEQVWSAATVPGAPTITSTFFNGSDVTVNYTPPTSDGGATITSYVFYVNGSVVTPNSETFGSQANVPGLSGDGIQMAAVNVAGEGPKSNTLTAG